MRLRRVLVAEDNPIFLAIVTSLLSSTEGIEVVGTAGSGREALDRVDVLRPDLVLMDLAMPEMNGLAVVRRLAVLAGRPRVIIMTAHKERAYRAAALRAGADGFLQKSELLDQLLPLMQTLSRECDNGPHHADDNS